MGEGGEDLVCELPVTAAFRAVYAAQRCRPQRDRTVGEFVGAGQDLAHAPALGGGDAAVHLQMAAVQQTLLALEGVIGQL
ncbi:hypothetical protein [Streptomyces sp. SCL15-6]|uniref:hypothetical protein n=1 Tax=Streptomyces sp. SCL15-6 TaxID=2967222 RepID=UPI0029667AB8|nr:hypothetical protein [Streptomyces sp. SCL15-6]